MVLDVAGEVHGAGAVHGAVDLHVAVDRVQVFLFVLEQRGRPLLLTGARRRGLVNFCSRYLTDHLVTNRPS